MNTDTDTIDADAVELDRYNQATSLFLTHDPDTFLTRATQAATALAHVIRDRHLYTRIRGKDHVHVEGWTLLGSLLGVYPITEWTRPIDDGWEARVTARTRAGELVGAAESMCLRKETRWRTADDYAIRSMAATRATSKALRLPLGFVIELAGFDPTPADEIPDDPPPAAAAAAAAAAAGEDKSTIPPEARPTKRQAERIGQLLATLAEQQPDTDWPAAARDHVGVPSHMLTKAVADQLIGWLEQQSS
jgi:hypothetical protein